MSTPVARFLSLFQTLIASLKRRQSLLVNLKGLLPGCLVLCLAASLWISTITVVRADSPPPGELFELHCAGCHPNGVNIIRRGKSLKQKALKRYGYTSADAIATLITNGKGLMSAYGDQLSEDEISSLATYVLEQAAVNWKAAE